MVFILKFNIKKTLIVGCFCLLFTVSIPKSSEKEGVNIVYLAYLRLVDSRKNSYCNFISNKKKHEFEHVHSYL